MLRKFKISVDGTQYLVEMEEVGAPTPGQSVNHFHVHLIPRYKDNDSLTIEFHEIEKPDFEELMNKLK